MVTFINLFGNLVLGMLASGVTFVSILYSIFQEGISSQKEQYNNQKIQTEKNIKSQLKKLSSAKKLDTNSINLNLKKLRDNERNAAKMLRVLDPKVQVTNIFIPMITSYTLICVSSLFTENIKISSCLLIISILVFSYAIFMLYQSMCIVIDIKLAIDQEKNKLEGIKYDKIVELLEKGCDDTIHFVKNFSLNIGGTNLNISNPTLSIECQKINDLKIRFTNSEKSKMVKNLEIGIILPNSFLVEKTGYDTLTNSSEGQIIRIKRSFVQLDTDLWLTNLKFTPLDVGEFKINTFVKAENIAVKNQSLSITVK